MQHFLITRWDLPGCLHEPGLERVSDDRWRARRRELFDRYCLPSVAGQTAEDFTWLFLVFHGLTSEEELRWFAARDPRLRLVAVTDPETSGATEARDEVRRLAAGDDWVITTRLDSDDVLHPEHLRRVRVEYEGERRVVEFANGFYYDVLRDELRQVRELQNAFVSVVEPVEDVRTAFAWAHHEIGDENDVLYLEEPGWVALVHDQNTTTYLWGDRMAASRKRAVLREFRIDRPPFLRARVRRVQRLGRRVGRLASRVARRSVRA